MNDSAEQTADRRHARHSYRRVVASAAIGQFVEYYDFIIYAYTASVIATLFFPADSRVASLLATFAVYAVGFVMRPLGGLLFGHLGDRLGRRGVLAAIILLMGGSTAFIGVLPTYGQIGLLAPVLLVVARLVQGLSVGGEFIGANALVAEHAPRDRRGAHVAFAYAFGITPGVFVALLLVFLTRALGPETFETWGWRVPFLLGGVLSLVGVYIRRRVAESPAFEVTRASERVARVPILSVLRDHRRALGYAFATAVLSGLGSNVLAAYFPSYLIEAVKLDSSTALAANSIALIVSFLTIPLGGLLSDRIGRRPTMMIAAAGCAVVAMPAYLLASAGSFATAIIGQSLLAVPISLVFGVTGILWLELFPTRTRYSGAAVSVNAANVLFGGTTPLVGTWLVDATGSLLAPGIYVAVLAALVFAVARKLPETHHASMVRAEDAAGGRPVQHGTGEPEEVR